MFMPIILYRFIRLCDCGVNNILPMSKLTDLTRTTRTVTYNTQQSSHVMQTHENAQQLTDIVNDENTSDVVNRQESINSLDQYKFTTPKSTSNKRKRVSNDNCDGKSTITKQNKKSSAKLSKNGLISSLAPIVPTNSIHSPPSVLILGSMASEASLLHQQFYAYKYNHFWSILSNIFGVDMIELPYDKRKDVLRENGIAGMYAVILYKCYTNTTLWDVIKQCVRAGSLDSSIKNPSINDFHELFSTYTSIHTVLCNGMTSYTLFNKHVNNQHTATGQLIIHRNIRVLYVPFSSPAHAVSNAVQVKAEKWRIAMGRGISEGGVEHSDVNRNDDSSTGC